MDDRNRAADPATPPEALPLVESILRGTAPRAIRLAASRGALPLPRAGTYRVLIALSADADAEIREQAAKSLASRPPGESAELAADPSTDPAILAWLIARPDPDASLLATILSNPSLPLEALAETARGAGATLLDMLLLNQTLLIRNPRLLDEVEANPAATPLQRSRVEEFRRHFLSPASGPRKAPAAPPAPLPLPEGPMPQGPAARSAPSAPVGTAGGAAPEAPGTEEPTDGQQAETLGVMQRILQMNVAEKIALASKGTREERTILIRDSNRSVQDAVLNSPKMTENEVEAIAKMRNVNEDILRQIAGQRDWIKNYSIVHGLTCNPKTPLGIAMNLLNRLNTRDLKMMLTDKNLPDALRRLARKAVEARAAKGGGR